PVGISRDGAIAKQVVFDTCGHAKAFVDGLRQRGVMGADCRLPASCLANSDSQSAHANFA
ncbi:hypothetical protein, partial [Aquitalea sp. ASV15]|uniref:hypothetical protein n=1 Tax=Aquitalea sp. ASV15 TaxID=2795104 RepID=UPI001E3CB489